MSNIEYIPLFPQLVTRTNTNPEFLEFRDKFIDCAYDLRSKSSGITRSNKNGWPQILISKTMTISKIV